MPNQRLKPDQIISDTNAFAALKTIVDYNPVKATHSIREGEALQKEMVDARAAEVQAEVTVKTARDAADAAERAFHQYMLGVKDYVTAQYGPSSDELQRLGLKKKSDYKSGGRRSKSDEPAV